MTQVSSRSTRSASLAVALLLSAAALNSAAAGPFGAAESVATPGGTSSNFVQLKQISGFTGQLAFSFSDGGYTPLGSSINKLIKLRFSVDCPANYRVHEAGIRVRGSDVNNYDFELVSPGDVPYDQNTWEQVFEQEPWAFDAVVATGIDALDAAGNNGPVYVSLNEVLDSRTEFYGSCSASQPSSGLPFLYYDSTLDNGDMKPMTRVRYSLQYSAITGLPGQTKTAAQPTHSTRLPATRLPERLRHRDRATSTNAAIATVKPKLKAPGGCPYDCPPPAQRLQLRK